MSDVKTIVNQLCLEVVVKWPIAFEIREADAISKIFYFWSMWQTMKAPAGFTEFSSKAFGLCAVCLMEKQATKLEKKSTNPKY
jgi:hypothetical protein